MGILSTPRPATPASGSVRLLESAPRPTSTAVERLVVALLREEGDVPLSSIVERVARHLYHDALSRGGWAADIGLFGQKLFRAEAARLIEAGDGLLWKIERRTEAS